MSTFDDIKALAEIVKNETANNANTATRIGNLLIKIIEAIESIIPGVATTTENGLMSSADKSKLDGIEEGAQKNPDVATTESDGLMSAESKQFENSVSAMLGGSMENDENSNGIKLAIVDENGKTRFDTTIPFATTTKAGVMSKDDKENANKAVTNVYTDQEVVPNKDVVKLYKLTADSNITEEEILPATENYAGVMSTSDKKKLDGIEEGAQKNPSAATSSSDGLMSSSDKEKLDKISLTDLTNMKSSITRLGISQLSSDADDVKSTIRLFAVEGSTNVPSIPCYLEVLAYHQNFILQRATDLSGVEMRRVFTDNTWSQWQ